MNKINKIINDLTTPEQFETDMESLNNTFFDTFRSVINTIFSSTAGIVGLIAGLATFVLLILALLSSDRRKGYLIGAGVTLVILLLALSVFFVFGE